MKETGIIYCGESVRATLADLKTQTRRVIKPQPPNWLDNFKPIKWPPIEGDRIKYRFQTLGDYILKCPYGAVGDRLWVRETWNWGKQYDDKYICFINNPGKLPIPNWAKVVYKADDNKIIPQKWISPIHMPKWAARLWLEITGIRVEWVQDISRNDCESEGCKGIEPIDVIPEFAYLWDSLNAKPKPAKRNPYTNEKELCKVAYPWDEVREEIIISRKSSRFYGCKVYIVGNPWVWPISYKRIEKP